MLTKAFRILLRANRKYPFQGVYLYPDSFNKACANEKKAKFK